MTPGKDLLTEYLKLFKDERDLVLIAMIVQMDDAFTEECKYISDLSFFSDEEIESERLFQEFMKTCYTE